MSVDPEHENRLLGGRAMAGDGRDRANGDGVIPANEHRKLALLQDFETLVAGAGRQAEDIGAPLFRHAPACGARAERRVRAAQIAVVGHLVAQIEQSFGKSGNPQSFRTHAGTAHRGPGGSGNA
jgi:hypothetical protein